MSENNTNTIKLLRVDWKDGMDLSVKVFKNQEEFFALCDRTNVMPFVSDSTYGLFEINNDIPYEEKSVMKIDESNQIKITTFKGITRKGFIISQDFEMTLELTDDIKRRFEDNRELGLYVKSGLIKMNDTERSQYIQFQENMENGGLKFVSNYYIFSDKADLDDHLLIGKIGKRDHDFKVTNYIPPCVKLFINQNRTDAFTDLLIEILAIYEKKADILFNVQKLNQDKYYIPKIILDIILNHLLAARYTFTKISDYGPKRLFNIVQNLVYHLYEYLNMLEKVEKYRSFCGLDMKCNSKFDKQPKTFKDFLSEFTKLNYNHEDIKTTLDYSEEMLFVLKKYLEISSFKFKDDGGITKNK